MNRIILRTLACGGAAVVFAGSAFATKTAYVDGRTVYSDFVYAKDNSSLISEKTTFRFEDKGDALVMRFTAANSLMKDVVLDPAKGPWDAKDTLDMFLDPSGEGKQLIQIAVGANGSVWDSRTPHATAAQLGWKASVKADAKGWSATVTLPYAAFGAAKPKVGAKWKISPARSYYDTTGSRIDSSWALVGSIFKRPNMFGTLYFGDRAAVAAAHKVERLARTAELRKELAAKGFGGHFARQLKALEDGAPATLIDEIRDELKVLEGLK